MKIDFVIYSESNIVIVECDENQHKWYDVMCELARMTKIIESTRLAGHRQNIHFVRYNPDNYSIDEKRKIFGRDKRHLVLKERIDDLKNHKGDSQVKIHYMFYDTENGVPCILNQSPESIKQLVVS